MDLRWLFGWDLTIVTMDYSIPKILNTWINMDKQNHCYHLLPAFARSETDAPEIFKDHPMGALGFQAVEDGVIRGDLLKTPVIGT